MRRWLKDFGFPVLVLAALAASGYLAAAAPVPGLRATKMVRAAAEQEVVMSSVVEALRKQEERLERASKKKGKVLAV